MKKEYILFIDSGVGGLSTMAETMKLMQANFIYFADNLHSPYGCHTKTEIFNYLSEIIKGLLKNFNIKIVVLACNTATTSSIENLRNTFKDIQFIGTEPAVKLASDMGCKNVLCLATPTTLKQVRFDRLKNMAEGKVGTLSIPSLAMSIENFLLDKNPVILLNYLKDIHKICANAASYDGVVLGCTHYCLIKDELINFLHLPIYDGNFGVAKQISRFMNCDAQNSNVLFKFSKKEKGLTQKYRKILSQILAKQTKLC